MSKSRKFGYVMVGLIVGLVAAQALPIFANQGVMGFAGSMMGSGHMGSMMRMMGSGHMQAMHGMMGSDHMAMMHGMMADGGACPMGHSTGMLELCQSAMADDPAVIQQCENLMASGQHTPDDCPMFE